MTEKAVTFLEALHEKYDHSEPLSCIIFVPKSAPGIKDTGELVVPQQLSLSGRGISHSGEISEIVKLCQHVTELELCDNNFTDWTEVFSIINQMPGLHWLSMSRNPLSTATISIGEVSLPNVTHLVLNGMQLPWVSVWQLLTIAPKCHELHLGMNNYSSVEISDDLCFPSMKWILLNGNKISDWSDVVKIGQVFPNLENLVLLNNPLTHLSDICVTSASVREKSSTETDNNATVSEESDQGPLLNVKEDPTECDIPSLAQNNVKKGPVKQGDNSTACTSIPLSTSDNLASNHVSSLANNIDHTATINTELVDHAEESETTSSPQGDAAISLNSINIELSGQTEKTVCVEQMEGTDNTTCLQGDSETCTHGYFMRLRSLNLNGTAISDWSELHNLRHFPVLEEARLMDVAFLQIYPQELRRQLIVAFLPNISFLNRSPIGEEERMNAERAYIRHYMDDQQKPDRFYELEKKYGKLDTLAEVDMTPETHVTVTVTCEERSLLKQLDLQQTLSDLKKDLAKWVGHPPKQFQILHEDEEGWVGYHELRFLQRPLKRCGIRTGNGLFIRVIHH